MGRFKPLSRRVFLGGGASVMVGLPLLEAMMPGRAHAGGAGAAQRLLCIYVPNGMHMAAFTPAQTGANYTLTPILQPLAALQSDVLVLSGLDNTPGQPEGPGDHAGGTSAFLTATHVNKSETDITNGTSVDQVYADFIGSETLIPSLQLGIDGGGNTGGCDSGYSCAYSRNISWVGNQPLSKLTSPSTAFDLLFAGFDPGATAAELALRKANKLSVLDHTLAETEKLRVRLGTTDRIKVDEYLDSVRELELKVSSDDALPTCEPGTSPGDPSEISDHIDTMGDVIVKAFECDRTRSISFMMANAGSNRTYNFLPNVTDGHHNHSHHGSAQANYDALTSIDTWEVERLAVLLGKLKAADEGPAGSVLDNSMVFFSSEIEDGNAHRHTNMPIILAGGGGGTLTSGRHVSYQGDPVANLFTAMLQGLGVDIATFGDNGTGPLGNLA
jgi:hypothetical protein